jgi:hypothetical protein
MGVLSASALVVAGVAVLSYLQLPDEGDIPRVRMATFVQQQVSTIQPTANDLADLRLDGSNMFAGNACVGPGPLADVRAALELHLSGLPSAVRADMLQKALVEGLSVESAFHNTSVDTVDSGTIFTHYYYVNTRFSAPDTYESCVVVSGIAIEVAENIVGYTEQTTTELHTRPCFCAPFHLYCRSCPFEVATTTRTPVLARHALALSQHRKLRALLLTQAYEQVGGYVEAAAATVFPRDLLRGWNTSVVPLIEGATTDSTSMD